MITMWGSRVNRLLIAWGAVVAVTGCAGPGFVDRECIKGRISDTQAKAVNDGPWGHLPSYNRDDEGNCVECAEEGDRIFAAHCANLIKKLTFDK